MHKPALKLQTIMTDQLFLIFYRLVYFFLEIYENHEFGCIISFIKGSHILITHVILQWEYGIMY